MSEMTCPRCGRATADGLLCNGCLAHGRDQLAKIARHWDDVYVRKTGPGGGSSGFGARVPVTDAQAKVLAYVRNQLSTWVRELDMGDTDGLADDPIAWCHWLAARMQRVRTHAASDEAIDEYDYCAGLVIAAISPRQSRTGCGKCPTCGADVFAVGDDSMGTCKRCEEAGVVIQLPRLSQRGDLWAQVPDRPMPRRLLMDALPMFGLAVKPATFRQWVFQGRLKPVDEVNGAPRYRVSDVRALIESAGRGTVTASA